ncbi:MAG: alpha/beta fold hydrolase [Variibacter sp.]
MPTIATPDGLKLYYEETGAGTPVVFVHEYAGDYRSWEHQMRHFARSHRCITYSQRGYLPSDVPSDGSLYSQDHFRDDVIALMDALKIEKAHVVGHSMGAYTALHVGIHYPKRCLSVAALGCGWGSKPDPSERAAMKAKAQEYGQWFAEEGKAAAAKYADAPMRQAHKHKDPRGWAEFARILGEHDPQGKALTMFNLQMTRPTVYDMEKGLREFAPPLLIIVGDEDEPCVEGSFLIKQMAPTAALMVIPRAGHTIQIEEPAAVNAGLADLFAAAKAGRWLAHKGK